MKKNNKYSKIIFSKLLSIFIVLFLTLGNLEANSLDQVYSVDPLKRNLITVLNEEINIASQHALEAVSDLNNEKNITEHIKMLREKFNFSNNGSSVGNESSLKLIPIVEQSLAVVEKSNAPKHIIASFYNILRLLKSISDKADMIIGGASPLAMGFFSEEIVKQFNYIIKGEDLDQSNSIEDQKNEGGLEAINKWHSSL